ncbi:hypothetical protein GobsT_51380 [Gemmata obscuriglobus]|uniref:Pesticin C-terminal domain-containing protein n=1 Tax=Gemmata obscuriglobus TaxID=114 RepID=A0A2Z3H7J1_9BACT|nr:pesticin C-terminus-like muramidase [Gemmata obscuriglobus]AWM36980.1 hypothetical protein C1280_08070 [Gemmata obscuriglobus]QEG30333.1 hypothetical protein GobsT_51380 [Gemmata obscuriglobus]VTS09657.1 Calcium-binding protein OS=Cystobacter violaceus Cb vi76 GN=Q664_06245 PE=4 SV=1 [Gemmata obscuriglobus UQM 2246]
MIRLPFAACLLAIVVTTSTAANDDLKVPRGQLTFDAEGNDDPKSVHFSRRPHVPSASSGVTIGRGYDLKERSIAQAEKDLTAAGVPGPTAKSLADGAGKKGDDAKAYVKANLAEVEITRAQQKALFAISYDEAAADVKRICEKNDVVETYGKVDWDKLDPKVRDVLVDLRFRGDYTPASRKLVQPLAVKNDSVGLAKVMADPANWPGVPKDRIERRKAYLVQATGRR